MLPDDLAGRRGQTVATPSKEVEAYGIIETMSFHGGSVSVMGYLATSDAAFRVDSGKSATSQTITIVEKLSS